MKKRASVTPLLLIAAEMGSTKKSPSWDSPTDSTALQYASVSMATTPLATRRTLLSTKAGKMYAVASETTGARKYGSPATTARATMRRAASRPCPHGFLSAAVCRRA